MVSSLYLMVVNQRASRIAGWVACFLLAIALTYSPARADDDACKRLLVSGNPDYPPYLWPNPDNPAELIGANAEFIRAVGKEIGVEISVVNDGPWGRVQEEMRRGNIDLIAGAFFTPKRTLYMDYLKPAFQGTRTRIWTLDNFPRQISSWDELIGLEGVTVINNSFGPEFDNFARENLTLRESPTLAQSLRLVELGRADYLVYEDFPAAAFIAKNNLANIVANPVDISAEDLFVTMSRNSPCNTENMRVRLSSAIRKLVDDGLMKRLLASNLEQWGQLVN
ncbi:substrate-binding periplasmic protein [Thalassospira marina]|uniref:ABC transporter substrate-binding protein n=1 Tax=Thalassospira marina TaxID=2048283 RepID=A0A2N3KGM9_9PROT|nr:transporter substrate-binding domain-containing protein [Thalassospira marina]PKR49737.1 ABC transporter substrate-binding protein [Thalassospira marina]